MNFFVLGPPKCGTTALAKFLSGHPDICMSRPKEPHFFDAGYARGIERHLKDSFAHGRPGQILGEATPSYLMVPYVAERIHRARPDAKLIVMLRNPVDRAYSSWWMLYSRGMERLAFKEAVEAEMNQPFPLDGPDGESRWIEQVRAIRSGSELGIRTYLAGGRYATNLRRYLQHFSRGQIQAVSAEDLRKQPGAVLPRIWKFLGVNSDAPVPGTKAVNEAFGTSAGPVLKLAKSLGLMRLRKAVPESVKGTVKRNLAGAGDRLPPMDPEMRTKLLDIFHGEIEDLETLLGVDLRAWRE